MSNGFVPAGFLKESGIDLHAEQTRLADRIAKIEEYLSSAPWKSETYISLNEHDPRLLYFERKPAGWMLAIYDANARNRTLVRDASLEAQSEVALHLPRLIERMQEQFEVKAMSVAMGHAALDQLEKQLTIHALSETGFLGIRPTPVRKAGKAGS